MPLNAKQECFCLEYVKDKNATQAAIRAGYSEASAGMQGGRLIKNDEIKSRVDELLSEVATEAKVDAAWVLKQLKTVVGRCMQTEPVLDRKGKQVYCETPDGDVVPAFTFNAMGANKAIELIGKHIGVKAFEDVVKISGTLELSERLARAKARMNEEGDETEQNRE